MKSIYKNLILLFLLSLPLAFTLGLIYGFFNGFLNGYQTLLPIENFVVPPEYINGIISANGIIIGFWAAIIGLSHKEHKLLWRDLNVVQLLFFVSLGCLILSVFLFAFQALKAVPSFYTLASCVFGFYVTCVCLGITLHFFVFRR